MKLIVTFILLSLSAGAMSQDFATDPFSTYYRVKIYVQNADEIRSLQQAGIDIDHYRGKIGGHIEVWINGNEVEILRTLGLRYEVVAPGVNEKNDGIESVSGQDIGPGRAILREQGIRGFEYGSMGGFYTYTEVVRELDSMLLQYPNLVTARESLGVTAEGRTIWAVEISDNPGQHEPEEAIAYYDALHHAREPMSMAVLMYYMYWLLDNYGTNPEATYLVNNRRLCFVPVVNPDGYVYNQSTNPNGGGGWRKNRRVNFDGSRGVDLNRNYGYQWGFDNNGSSPTPSSETYRGPTAWSEPESQAVRDYTTLRQPSIAFSTHSVAGRYLNPYGFKDTVVAFEYYAEFASDFSALNDYLYGTVYQMLNYNSNGTTRDFLHHDLNCLTWTPEIGGSDFWPLQSEIIPLAQENLLACKYLSWVAGAFADYQSFSVVGRPPVRPGDTLGLAVTVRNKGLTKPARSIVVNAASLYPNITALTTQATYDSIKSREAASNTDVPFEFVVGSNAQLMDEMRFAVTITQEGIVTSMDTLSVILGFPRVLFEDNAENGILNWTRGGNQVPWDTSFVMGFEGSRSFADSRYGNVGNSTNNHLTTNGLIDLAGTTNPRLEYFARWANEANYDYVRVQLSTNNGTNWLNLTGRQTRLVGGQPAYTANKGSWAWEHINLNAYAGRQIKIRFNLVTDGSLRGDGFYFDNFRIVDYRDSVSTGIDVPSRVPLMSILLQNFPNPFNPTTKIGFQNSQFGFVSLKIYDVLGREVVTLVNEELPPGRYDATFDANSLPNGCASGIYFYRLQAGSFVDTRKLLLVR